MTIDIVEAAGTHHRLTVTPTRTTLKMTAEVFGSPDTEAHQRLVAFAHAVDSFIRSTVYTARSNHSMRGSIVAQQPYSVKMQNDARTFAISCNEGKEPDYAQTSLNPAGH